MAKRGTLTHRKTRRLARALGGVPLPYALGVVEALFHATQTHAPDGAIGSLSDDSIAEEMWWDGDPATLVRALIEAGFVDENADHRLVVHGWAEHADTPTHMALARKKQRFATGEAPNCSRLPKFEREAALAHFADSCAPKRTESESVRTKPESVRTETHGERMAARIPSPPLPAPPNNPPTPQAPSRSPGGDGGPARAEDSMPEPAQPKPQQPQEPQPQPDEPTPEQIAEAQANIDRACESMGVTGGFFLGRGELKKAGPVLQPLFDDWKARFGGVPKHQAMRSAMLPLIEDHGLAEVQERWQRYLAKVESRFASPGSFAAKWDEWGPPRSQPCHLKRSEDIQREERERYERQVAAMPPEIREIELHGTPEQKLELARKLAEENPWQP